MAAVQQHTPSSESRRSKDFMESMEEEVRRCSDMLQRRQSKRGMRTLNGFARISDSDMHSGDEAGVGRRFSSTLPRSFTMPSNPETRELPMPHHSRQKNRSPSGSRQQSNRSPRTPTMKAPIGATFHVEREPQKTPEVYRGRSAPPESTGPYSNYFGASSSGSEFGYSSRESSVTPRGTANRSSSSSPRSSMSPPPVAPKPTKSREKGWTNMRKVNGTTTENSPRVIRALPDTSSRSQSTIPVSNKPIQLPTSPMPMEFPSAEVDAAAFGGFGEIVPQTPPLESNTPESTTPQSEHEPTTAIEAKMSDNSTTSLDNIQMTECEQIDGNQLENDSPTEDHSAETEKTPETTISPIEPEKPPTAVTPESKESSPSPHVTAEPQISDDSELSAPEVKTVPRKTRHRSVSREESSSKQVSNSPGKRHSRTLSESKIHITVSSSVKMEDVVQSADKKKLPPMDDKVAAMMKDLQAKLQEKEEQLSKINEQREKELLERDEQIKKLAKDNKKVEREKWELLKRARDAAERALHLRTQLDMKEGSIRSTQSELDRTKDELYSVKSANTSLRALLSELRAPQANTTGMSVGIQVDIGGGTLKRNRSMELAFSEGGLSQEQQLETPASTERAPDFRTSTNSLSTHWPLERTNSDREEAVSLCEDMSHYSTSGMSASQPTVPWPELKKGKKKKTSLLTGRLRRSTGSKRGSVTSVDGLDMSNSSILQGSGLRGTGPITFPYNVLPSNMKEHWKMLEKAQSIPFQDWTLQHIVAWIEAGLGMNHYSDAVREKAPSGAALLTLSDSDLEKKLGISHPLHRRKLRLAIEEQRDPSSCQFPQAGKIDHSWVAFEWAHDCGLAHLTELLISNLVDGRLLNTLSKEDIRKHLKINKKTDQLSFLSAVELLRMHDFNRQAIQEHRRTANNPLYWTNRDVCDWLKDIQLEEYATNVIGGGVHGALLFLERGHFTSDHLASIIQIPSSKGQLRRHLAGKMARLFTEDISQSVESLPTHVMTAGSPARLSPQTGSQSPDRRHTHHSPHHQNNSPTPPPSDCPHPSRKNSLTRRSQPLLFEALTQPVPAGPRQFGRVSSGPSPRQQRLSQVAAAERVRLSLRESALRSVSSINEESPQTSRPDIAGPSRSFTPTLIDNSSGTTV